MVQKGRVRETRGVYRNIRVRRQAVLLGFVLLLIVGGSLSVCLAGHLANRVTRERPAVEEIDGIPLHTVLVPEGFEGRPGVERRVKYVVIHETGNPSKGADAQAHSNYLQNGGEGTTSWHYTVDDHEIYQHIPDHEVAWHAGDRLAKNGGNLNGVSIELCVNADGDFEKTFDNGARLAAFLLGAYGLDSGDLRQHNAFNGKNCPQTIREAGRWEEFVELTAQYQKGYKKS